MTLDPMELLRAHNADAEEWRTREKAAQERIADLQAANAELERILRRAREDEERLRASLLEYGRHKDDCVFWLDDDSDLAAYGPGGCCTCGLYEATLTEESHTPQETTG